MNTQQLPGAALRQKILERLPELATHGICPIPNQRFWDFYRERKSELQLACIGVRKDKAGNWCIVKYPHIDKHAEIQRKIDELRSKHSEFEYCQECGSQIFTIRKYVQSNHVDNFAYWCDVCQTKLGSVLPHPLVEHLVETQGFRIVDTQHPYLPNVETKVDVDTESEVRYV